MRLFNALKSPIQAGAGGDMLAPRSPAQRLYQLTGALGLATSLTACVTQQPAPTPRPVQATGAKCDMPVYPTLARRLNVQAMVAVRLKVEPDGSVSDARVERPAQAAQDWRGQQLEAAQALDAAALRMAKSCRFGAVSGHHTAAWARLPVNFQLTD